jgi:lactoylglutathione lyase
MLSSIPYITLWAVRFDDCVRFYRDLLGLTVEYQDENFIQFATQGTRLYMHRLGTAPPLRDHTVEIHFDVPDVDKAYRALLERGAVFDQAPEDMSWGTRMAALTDPEGYAIEIVGPLKGTM